jgi:hypothetical protein
MATLSTDALLVILVASTLAMLATWGLSRRRGSMAHRLLVIACAFCAGVSIGTTFALAVRTPWLWSSLRIAGLRASRTEAVASNRLIPVPVPVLSDEPGTSNAAAQPSRASTQPSGASIQTKTNGERAGRVDQAPPGRDPRLKSPAGPPDRPVTTWERRGGTVVALDGPTLTIEEMGQWTGTSTRATRTSIMITSETRIELLERARDAPARDPLGSFRASSLARSDLRAGDYVTVTTQSTGERHVATSIAVVRPSGPRLESKSPSGDGAATSDAGAQPPARGSADIVSPRRSEAPLSASPPAPIEVPARPRAEGRSEDGSAVIDWFLNR